LTRIVEAFDPPRRAAWLAAWDRVQRTAGLGLNPEHGPAGADSADMTKRGASPGPEGNVAGHEPGLGPSIAAGHRADSVSAGGPDADENPTTAARSPRPAARWRAAPTRAFVAAAIGLLAVGLGAGFGLGALLFRDGTAPIATPSPRAAASPPGCYDLPLQTAATIVDQRGADQYGVRVAEASYTYFPDWNPSLEVGGQLTAPVPAGKALVAASWADPRTTDSTPLHDPGNGRYYPGDVLTVSDELCFRGPRGVMGYPGYPGITTRIVVMLADKNGAAALAPEAERLDGFTDRDLAIRGADIIGYFDIPTAPMTPPPGS